MKVRLEPIGETIDCGPEETVLDAAFRQRLSLAHGCREGQCSACKCYLLVGDVELAPYSNFALSDTERSEGYALMCRSVPTSDVVVELLHYDPDNYRLENAIREATGVVEAVVQLTEDIFGVTVTVPEDFAWLPGQYIDVHVPGEDGARRSFSVASLPDSRHIELMIKRYPRGRLSGMLGSEIVAGSQLAFTGPYGAFHLRPSDAPILMVAGGSGMAPVLGVLRQLAAESCARPIRFFYGARSPGDLFATDEIARLGERLADFRFTPVTEGFVHDAIDEELESPDVYMCGPPPMLEAVEALLTRRGVDPARIFQDRFTPSAAAAAKVAEAPATVDERAFAWFDPAGRRATLYEDVTVDTQPSVHRHLRRGWAVSFADGRGTWDDGSTALRSADWFDFRDPGEQWERPFYRAGSAIEQQIEGAVGSAAEQDLFGDFSREWVSFLSLHLQVPAFIEHGLWFALATAARDCLSDTVATCVCLQAAHKQRSAQAIVLYAMDLEPLLGTELPIEPARAAFLHDDAWQPARRYLERLAARPDWGEVLVAANLCFEPTVATLVRRELGTRAAAAHGDTVTPVLARAETQEWEWARRWTAALTRFLLTDAEHGSHNRSTITGWVRDWLPDALAAAAALAPVAETVGVDATRAAERIRGYAGQLLEDAGLPECCALVGHAPTSSPGGAGTLAPRTAVRAPRRAVARDARPTSSTGTYDYVGIVMAKSAEGDAVARCLAGHDGIEVLEQASFWDVRARDRLVIDYDEVSQALGYEIDAYSIQHEMSTHYGRMVATDDALMLFSDPTEAMEHLLS
ncbi:MAG TPA: MmoB/DmpM family protein [Solirubrobacteraceae bacterium]|nr:MmoB/DmpM family protein [Solirubrobacteraceae bacterium]